MFRRRLRDDGGSGPGRHRKADDRNEHDQLDPHPCHFRLPRRSTVVCCLPELDQTPILAHGPQIANVIPAHAWMFTNSVEPSGPNVDPANSSPNRGGPPRAPQPVQRDVEQVAVLA